jgi:hypothetical protein
MIDSVRSVTARSAQRFRFVNSKASALVWSERTPWASMKVVMAVDEEHSCLLWKQSPLGNPAGNKAQVTCRCVVLCLSSLRAHQHINIRDVSLSEER